MESVPRLREVRVLPVTDSGFSPGFFAFASLALASIWFRTCPTIGQVMARSGEKTATNSPIMLPNEATGDPSFESGEILNREPYGCEDGSSCQLARRRPVHEAFISRAARP